MSKTNSISFRPHNLGKVSWGFLDCRRSQKYKKFSLNKQQTFNVEIELNTRNYNQIKHLDLEINQTTRNGIKSNTSKLFLARHLELQLN